MRNPYRPLPAVLEDVITETPNIKTFVLRSQQTVSFETGQFVELTVPGIGEAPFTPSSSPSIDQQMDITIMSVGKVTSALHALQPGAKLGVRGPYGHGYPLDQFEGKEVLIVGGGVGLAPLRSLLFSLFDTIDRYRRVQLCYGAKTPADLVYKRALPDWEKRDGVDVLITVDKGDETWKGREGVVTTLFKEIQMDIPNSVAVVCGPPVMMKFATFDLVKMGYKPEQIFLSMEKNMCCGIGKCGHCNLGPYYVCKDGPVFTYEQIKNAPEIWD